MRVPKASKVSVMVLMQGIFTLASSCCSYAVPGAVVVCAPELLEAGSIPTQLLAANPTGSWGISGSRACGSRPRLLASGAGEAVGEQTGEAVASVHASLSATSACKQE